MEVGTVFVVRPLDQIEASGGNTDDLFEGQEFVVTTVDTDLGMIYCGDIERFTIEKDKSGLNWETFFTVKESAE